MKMFEDVVDLTITASRLPISLYERVRGEEVRATWPPLRLVNTIDALVLDLAGQVFGSDKLAARARLLRSSVERAVEAEALETEARRVRAEADERFDARREAAERAEQSVEERAEAKREAVAAEAAEKKREAQQRAAARTKAQREAEARREREVEKEERRAAETRIAAERRALAEERKAVAAEAKAIALDDAVEATKARRQAERRSTN